MLNMAMLKLICHLDYKIEGLEKLQERNCIVMSKHQSAWETISLRGLLPPAQAWVLKRELLSVPLFGWALKRCNPIAIDRNAGRKAVKQVLEQGMNALNKGRWVVIFPEGTRVAPGKRKKYGIGGALLAERSEYPVVPIAHDAGYFWRRRDLKKHPGTIEVVVGDPISSKGKNASQINKEVESWIEGQMEKFHGESRTRQ
jgi:1-acyl-sn-glycerol-3-phosphate acyltransferase